MVLRLTWTPSKSGASGLRQKRDIVSPRPYVAVRVGVLQHEHRAIAVCRRG